MLCEFEKARSVGYARSAEAKANQKTEQSRGAQRRAGGAEEQKSRRAEEQKSRRAAKEQKSRRAEEQKSRSVKEQESRRAKMAGTAGLSSELLASREVLCLRALPVEELAPLIIF